MKLRAGRNGWWKWGALYRRAKRSVAMWRMDEKYRTRPKGAIETTSQDLSRIPLASFYLSVHDPCDIDASPSYFIGVTPRSFRNCTRGGGPQNVLLALFSRHSEMAYGKKRATIIEIVLHRFSITPCSSRWEEFSFTIFFLFLLENFIITYIYKCIICNKLRWINLLLII